MSELLRPVGSQFTVFHPPDKRSTNVRGGHYTYEVVAHVKVARFRGDGVGVLREEIRCVEITDETDDELKERLNIIYGGS